MSKKALIKRENMRREIFQKYTFIRRQYKNIFKYRKTLVERYRINRRLQKFPSNSVGTHIHNCCQISGRSRGYYHNFGLSRHFVRELVNQNVFSGMGKSSWSILLK